MAQIPNHNQDGTPVPTIVESPAGKRVLALNLPLFLTERLAREMPTTVHQPFATIEENKGKLVLVAVNPPAMLQSLSPGMVLADARALVPELATCFANGPAEAVALRKLAKWCIRYTPLVMVAGEHALFLDISGCAHLFGGEQALVNHLQARLVSFGLTPHVAIADTPGAAWAIVGAIVRNSQSDAVRILPPFARAETGARDAAWRALADCPVVGLRLDAKTEEALVSFGLRTIGALRPLARRDLAGRFGPALVQRLDQALGHADEVIIPIRPASPFIARRVFFDPIATAEDIAATVQAVLADLCQMLEDAGLGAERLVLACHRVDGTTQMLSFGMARPSRWPEPLFVLLAEKLDQVKPDFGIEIVELRALRVSPLEGGQANWQGQQADRAQRSENFAAFVDRLGNRFGFASLARPAPVQSWLPERAVVRLGPFEDKYFATGPRWPSGRPRPLRLFARPELVDAVAPVPDDPPVLFRWHGRTFRVRAADGPERLSDEWWGAESQSGVGIRDYYTVEDEEGRRYWLYRDGLYKPGTPPQWYLHGLFG
jgi:protein ImuB